MRHILAIAITACAAFCAFTSKAQTQTADPDLLVTMPVPPERIENLTERCNYIVDNYWKTFNPKSSFSSISRLSHTLGTFFSVTPYATADTVHQAIGALLQQVGKARPSNLIELAKLAEAWTYCDTAEFASEELYFPFVEAIANDRKAKGPERDRYVYQYNQLLGSRVGQTAPDFRMTLRDGTVKNFSEITAPHIILFFYDPECEDCRAAKTRLDADFTLSALIRRGEAAIVAVYTGDDPSWKQAAASLPESWTVGSAPEADTRYTMASQPEIYYISGADHRVEAKDLDAGQIIDAFRVTFSKPVGQ